MFLMRMSRPWKKIWFSTGCISAGFVVLTYPVLAMSGVITGAVNTGAVNTGSLSGTTTATASTASVKTITRVMKSPPSLVQPEFLPPLPGYGPAGGNSSRPIPIETDNQSFQQAVPQTGFALTPKQIEQFHEIQLESAMATNKGPLVHGRSIVLPVSLAPGEVPPTIRLAFGYMTAISFVDSSGAAWPITSDALGNPAQFAPIVPKGGQSNILFIRPNVPGASTNIAILLKGLDTPVVFPITSTLQHADYRVTVQVDHQGPNAAPPVFLRGPDEQTASKALMAALEGVAPSGSHVLKISGLNHVQAWRLGTTMFVRSRATMVSPSWSGQASGDGYTAYQMSYAPALLFSSGGELVNARVNDQGGKHG